MLSAYSKTPTPPDRVTVAWTERKYIYKNALRNILQQKFIMAEKAS